MKTLLNLVAPKKTEDASKIVTVIEQVGNTSYSVADNQQRQYIAEAADTYLPGQSVVIKNGTIIGKTKSSQTYKEFTV